MKSTHILPSSWAPYLLLNDASDLLPEERERADAWLAANHHPAVCSLQADPQTGTAEYVVRSVLHDFPPSMPQECRREYLQLHDLVEERNRQQVNLHELPAMRDRMHALIAYYLHA